MSVFPLSKFTFHSPNATSQFIVMFGQNQIQIWNRASTSKTRVHSKPKIMASTTTQSYFGFFFFTYIFPNWPNFNSSSNVYFLSHPSIYYSLNISLFLQNWRKTKVGEEEWGNFGLHRSFNGEHRKIRKIGKLK